MISLGATLGVAVLRTNWTKEIERALKRSEKKRLETELSAAATEDDPAGPGSEDEEDMASEPRTRLLSHRSINHPTVG